MIRVEQVNAAIEKLIEKSSTPARKFIIDCLIELASYKAAYEVGLLVRVDGEQQRRSHLARLFTLGGAAVSPEETGDGQ